MPDYFDFIIYLAFEVSTTYQDIRSLSIQQLHDYRVRLLQKHISYHENFDHNDDLQFAEKLERFHKNGLAITPTEELEYLFKFIADHGDTFSYKNGIVSLKDEVTSKRLQKEKFDLPSCKNSEDDLICEELVDFGDSVTCLNVLYATKLRDLVYSIVEDEKEVEKAYFEGDLDKIRLAVTNKENYVNFKLRLIGNFNLTKMRCCERILTDFCAVDEATVGNDVWPLSADLMCKDPFYGYCSFYFAADFDNPFQRAIFDVGDLTYDRLFDAMRVLWVWRKPRKYTDIEILDDDDEQAEIDLDCEDEFASGDEEVSDYFDEVVDINSLQIYELDKKRNLTFYLTYIRELDRYMETCGTSAELVSSRNRLLYLLDAYDKELYEPVNFNRELSAVSEEKFKDDGSFYSMSREFLIDILEGWDEKFSEEARLKKVIFASTYYSLTGDSRIENIARKYNDAPLGKTVFKAVFDHDYGEFNRDTGKRLIKTDN